MILQIAFTRSLSNQLVTKGIRVNAVAPGPIWTPLIPATFPKVRACTLRLGFPQLTLVACFTLLCCSTLWQRLPAADSQAH